MKNTIIALVAIALLASCDKKELPNNLHLTGNIKGLKEGTLYVQKLQNEKLVTIDSIVINGDSKFEADIEIKSPEMLYLALNRGTSKSLDNTILFFAEPGNITIESNLDSYISGAKVTGSKNHDLYEEYKKINTHFRDEGLTLLEQKFKAIKFNHQSIADSLTQKQDSNTKRKYLFATNFALNNRDYEIAPYIALTDIYDINIKYLDTIQKSMSPKVAKSLYGTQLTKYVATIKSQEK